MSTCRGAPPPHYPCPHGDACDWDVYDALEPMPPTGDLTLDRYRTITGDDHADH